MARPKYSIRKVARTSARKTRESSRNEDRSCVETCGIARSPDDARNASCQTRGPAPSSRAPRGEASYLCAASIEAKMHRHRGTGSTRLWAPPKSSTTLRGSMLATYVHCVAKSSFRPDYPFFASRSPRFRPQFGQV